ncbi:uncharacterized protein LOC141632121 [Silene latifolia]|uniref:uncharacterized protein LOC141632121 n=1 Tax=Silene latifolia TaxID=37657 RepID=UPI003D76FAFF
MLVQAGNLYTPKIFDEFQEDYEEQLGAYIKNQEEDQSMHMYTIANVNETKERLVAIQQSFYANCLLWTRDARHGYKEVDEHHKEIDVKAHFTNRYKELCHRIENIVNRACESHETYNFVSKVCEESAKIIEQLLAKRQCPSEHVNELCHVSISMTSEELERNVDANNHSGSPKGIKKRQCHYKGRSCPKSWVEKSNRKVKDLKTQRKTRALWTVYLKNKELSRGCGQALQAVAEPCRVCGQAVAGQVPVMARS